MLGSRGVPAPRSFTAVFGPGGDSRLLVSCTFVRAGGDAAASLWSAAAAVGTAGAVGAVPVAQALRLAPPEGGVPPPQRAARALATAGCAHSLEDALASAARLSAACRARRGGERLGGRLADDVTEVVGAAGVAAAPAPLQALQAAPMPALASPPRAGGNGRR